MNENILGIVAGILTSVSMIPQLVKVLKQKNAEDLSWTMILVLISGLSLWVWYGFIKDELPIILSNAFAVVVNIILLICCMIYKKKK
ncbi:MULTISPECIES: SemiSWEET transporter [Chryseobacterium]|jgi:MtN3 and saliva related transmembrane protein|uniref:SemiSWEET transporter n=1 Tax=Chryseobacterium nepalense TaxID=1854498 RepID=A0ABY4K9W8_9FLAO|nr:MULTISPECIES: SemiSWEET transporter [Chryseobacterium]MEA1851058.1 SemiSWEET transporter [Chryseobacterium sp. MHB01]MEC5173609.1 MtN3 and saliva related transmembrane protein [Chryseobacterium nepalense]UPQ77354.1 SemiSWEET transporter [Chryseobacterium nepalense]